MSADKGQPTNPEHPAKKSLPNGHYFKIMGYLLTAAWVGYILAISGAIPRTRCLIISLSFRWHSGLAA